MHRQRQKRVAVHEHGQRSARLSGPGTPLHQRIGACGPACAASGGGRQRLLYQGAAGRHLGRPPQRLLGRMQPGPSPGDRKATVPGAASAASRNLRSASAMSRRPATPAGSGCLRLGAGSDQHQPAPRRWHAGRAPALVCRASASTRGRWSTPRRTRHAPAPPATAARCPAPPAPRCPCRDRTLAAVPTARPDSTRATSTPSRSGSFSERFCCAHAIGTARQVAVPAISSDRRCVIRGIIAVASVAKLKPVHVVPRLVKSVMHQSIPDTHDPPDIGGYGGNYTGFDNRFAGAFAVRAASIRRST